MSWILEFIKHSDDQLNMAPPDSETAVKAVKEERHYRGTEPKYKELPQTNAPQAVVHVPDVNPSDETDVKGSNSVGSPAFLGKDAQVNPEGLAGKNPEKIKDMSDTQLALGQKIEKEHTDNPDKAIAIAKDHLVEDPKYYTHLKAMENAVEEKTDVKTAVKLARYLIKRAVSAGGLSNVPGSTQTPDALPTPQAAPQVEMQPQTPQKPVQPAKAQQQPYVSPHANYTRQAAQQQQATAAGNYQGSQAMAMDAALRKGLGLTDASERPSERMAYGQHFAYGSNSLGQLTGTPQSNLSVQYKQPQAAGGQTIRDRTLQDIAAKYDPMSAKYDKQFAQLAGQSQAPTRMGGSLSDILGAYNQMRDYQRIQGRAHGGSQLAENERMESIAQEPDAQAAYHQLAQESMAPHYREGIGGFEPSNILLPEQAEWFNPINVAQRQQQNMLPVQGGSYNIGYEPPEANTPAWAHAGLGSWAGVGNRLRAKSGSVKQADSESSFHAGKSDETVNPADARAILDYVRENPELDDGALHRFADSKGIADSEADKAVYSTLRKASAYFRGVYEGCTALPDRVQEMVVKVACALLPEYAGMLKQAIGTAAVNQTTQQPMGQNHVNGAITSMLSDSSTAAERFMKSKAQRELKTRKGVKKGIIPHPQDVFGGLGNRLAIQTVAGRLGAGRSDPVAMQGQISG